MRRFSLEDLRDNDWDPLTWDRTVPELELDLFSFCSPIEKKTHKLQIRNWSQIKREKNHKKVILNAEFSPYFWIDFKSKKVAEKLEEFGAKASFEKREINGKQKEMIKAKFNSPEHLVECKKIIKSWRKPVFVFAVGRER